MDGMPYFDIGNIAFYIPQQSKVSKESLCNFSTIFFYMTSLSDERRYVYQLNTHFICMYVMSEKILDNICNRESSDHSQIYKKIIMMMSCMKRGKRSVFM